MKPLTSFLSFAALASIASAQITINEIRIDDPSTDDSEFLELAGAPGASLDGLTYIVIGDGTGGDGTIERVIDLDGLFLDANGFFLAANDTIFTGTPNLSLSSNTFENGDNVTHLLLDGFTGALNDDLDTDDDGIIDSTPWTSVISGVALVEKLVPTASSDEFVYADFPNTEAVGPDGTFVPGHVFRCNEGMRIGTFDYTTADVTDTPGAENECPALIEIFCSPAQPNSISTDGSILSLVSASGGSIAANDSTLVVTDTPDEFGVFAQSPSVMMPVTLATGGDLCLGFPDIQRLGAPILPMGNTASIALDFVNGGPAANAMSGVTMYYQWYHREGVGSNLSEGIAITWID